MSANLAAKRKTRSSLPYRTSALDALRVSGLAGMFAGAPDLASSRKRILKVKLRGKARAAR